MPAAGVSFDTMKTRLVALLAILVTGIFGLFRYLRSERLRQTEQVRELYRMFFESERYRRIRLVQLAPQDPQKSGLSGGDLDTLTWRETGGAFDFYRVSITPGETRWPFADNDFGEGASLLWDCMYDGASSAVGTVRSSFGVLAQWE